jgi:hypothetical protein
MADGKFHRAARRVDFENSQAKLIVSGIFDDAFAYVQFSPTRAAILSHVDQEMPEGLWSPRFPSIRSELS